MGICVPAQSVIPKVMRYYANPFFRVHYTQNSVLCTTIGEWRKEDRFRSTLKDHFAKFGDVHFGVVFRTDSTGECVDVISDSLDHLVLA